MDSLFPIAENPEQLLPYDGLALYYGTIFSPIHIQTFSQQLLHDIVWENDHIRMFGKEIITKRKVAWYGDQPFLYRYSNSTKIALPFTNTLNSIRKKIEEISGETYNSCLLNLYHNGEESMGWHSDNEKELQKNGAIASVSLGAARKFCFKHKRTQEKKELILENGSLLIMKGPIQEHWLHQLPPSKKIKGSRINLTFRTIVS
ncbi:alpha-ketoglutarate-dependent dioxygenase AlkB family protein [Sediminibacterium sp. TEGAF015]|uniref:alpha-ketoglutarate-dependent dioxygenase AlkB family protein n=1 Tax=Sediminibacterium sp. TEGAF015 TaxID=575378 RepID=UPI00220F6648|nr:alpha-ketoglutarate-dependent dioxygenase AlkB [Sediminibacterium sp. TEGAF015]BDQ12192.1 DNA methylase [Sediminibacterium sp. TEGAF015]